GVFRLCRPRLPDAIACGGRRRSAPTSVCLLVVGVGHHGGTPDEEGALASFEPHRGRSTGEQAVRSSANPRAAGTYRASSPEPLTLRASPHRVPFTLHQAHLCPAATSVARSHQVR